MPALPSPGTSPPGRQPACHQLQPAILSAILQDDARVRLWKAGTNTRLHLPLKLAGFRARADLHVALRRHAGMVEVDAGANAGRLDDWQHAHGKRSFGSAGLQSSSSRHSASIGSLASACMHACDSTQPPRSLYSEVWTFPRAHLHRATTSVARGAHLRLRHHGHGQVVGYSCLRARGVVCRTWWWWTSRAAASTLSAYEVSIHAALTGIT